MATGLHHRQTPTEHRPSPVRQNPHVWRNEGDQPVNQTTNQHHRPAAGQTSIRAEGSEICPTHRDKRVVLVCSDCNELICTTCCGSSHRNHTLEDITDVVSRQRGKLLDFVNDTEQNRFSELQKDLKSIKEKMAETEHDLDTVLPGQIQQHGEMCKTYIDRYISQLKSSCEEKKSENIGLLQAYENEIQKRYEDLVLKTKECKQLLQSRTSVLVYDKAKVVEGLKTEPPSMPLLSTTNSYKPETDISQHIKQVIGTIDNCATAKIGTIDNSATDNLRVKKSWWKWKYFLTVLVLLLVAGLFLVLFFERATALLYALPPLPPLLNNLVLD
ncbi:tripartite motif-containing protein 45-like [Mizuhopecten yessoensis]|uniref:tripartite motif-containing protein 45-like n=1 Tax=Mizuhopecten yessoensis TaxID=6573 RepID=UPI000B45F171|nr:tripartite motif-containing protein 45-like [Mizuhopecten yessoensis]